MKRFINNYLFFLLPLFLLFLYYLVADPFLVVWRFRAPEAVTNGQGCNNDALRGIQWMNAYKDSLHYNSFIIGSSRSDFYYVDEWKKYIGENNVCFHFNQSGDNLQGSLERIHYLYKRFGQINNILIIMDREYLEDMKQHNGHLFRNPWQVTEKWDFISFHMEFIRAFFSIEYQKRIFGKSSVDKNILPSHYDSRYNENYKDGAEDLLNNERYDEYYSRFDSFYKLYIRDSVERVSIPVIKKEQVDALQEIASLLESGNTECRIVISPLYNQEKLNPEDLITLKSIFGDNNVFDFSGVNEFTNDKYNYYETSHYRPRLCNRILGVIYSNTIPD